MPNLADMERNATKMARRSLYDALTKIGRAEAFNTATAADMDAVIEAIWRGFRESIVEQSRAANRAAVGNDLDDEIPF